MKHLKDYILESKYKPHPCLSLEIPTETFEKGDICLFRELMERGDENTILLVLEDRGNRCLAAGISSYKTMSLIPTTNYTNSDLFKIGHYNIQGRNYDPEKVYNYAKSIMATCE